MWANGERYREGGDWSQAVCSFLTGEIEREPEGKNATFFFLRAAARHAPHQRIRAINTNKGPMHVGERGGARA